MYSLLSDDTPLPENTAHTEPSGPDLKCVFVCVCDDSIFAPNNLWRKTKIGLRVMRCKNKDRYVQPPRHSRCRRGSNIFCIGGEWKLALALASRTKPFNKDKDVHIKEEPPSVVLSVYDKLKTGRTAWRLGWLSAKRLMVLTSNVYSLTCRLP